MNYSMRCMDQKLLTSKKINWALGISITTGFILAPILAFHTLFWISILFNYAFSEIFLLFVGAPFIALITVPFIAPKYLKNWTIEGKSIVVESIFISILISLPFALPAIYFGWSFSIDIIVIASFYGLSISVIYKVILWFFFVLRNK